MDDETSHPFALIMRLLHLVLMVLALTSSVGAHNANIQWSSQATQQVRDWANGGSQPWTHTIQQQRGPNGRYR